MKSVLNANDMLSKAQVSPLWMRSLFGCPAELWVSFLIKENMGCDGWTLNRVTFCQWQRNCTSDEMGTPKGNNGKDCT
jgi:hypothetical protein